MRTNAILKVLVVVGFGAAVVAAAGEAYGWQNDFRSFYRDSGNSARSSSSDAGSDSPAPPRPGVVDTVAGDLGNQVAPGGEVPGQIRTALLGRLTKQLDKLTVLQRLAQWTDGNPAQYAGQIQGLQGAINILQRGDVAIKVIGGVADTAGEAYSAIVDGGADGVDVLICAGNNGGKIGAVTAGGLGGAALATYIGGGAAAGSWVGPVGTFLGGLAAGVIYTVWIEPEFMHEDGRARREIRIRLTPNSNRGNLRTRDRCNGRGSCLRSK